MNPLIKMQPVKEIQNLVAEAIEQRGYRKDWTDAQFLARQIAKLQEELAEMAYHVRDDVYAGDDQTELELRIQTAGSRAKAYFDGNWFHTAGLRDDSVETREAIKSEAADCLVVLFNIAAVIEQITGEPFDLVTAALQKARSDVKRGVN